MNIINMARDPTEYLSYWPISYIVFSAPFGLFVSIFYVILLKYIFLPFNNTTSLLIMLFVVFGTIFRNGVIKLIFRYYPESLHEIFNITIKYYFLVALFAIILLAIGPILYLSTDEIIQLQSIPLILAHISILTVNSFSREGDIRFSFDKLYEDLGTFSKKQYWLKLIGTKVENKLKEGYIDLDIGKFVYHVNMYSGDESIKEVLDSLKNILITTKDEDIIDIISKIVPESELKQLKINSLKLEIYQLIKSDPKYYFGFLFLLLFLLINPKNWIDLLREFLI